MGVPRHGAWALAGGYGEVPAAMEYYTVLREQLKKCERCAHVNEMCGNITRGEETLKDLEMRLRAFCRTWREQEPGDRSGGLRRLLPFTARF